MEGFASGSQKFLFPGGSRLTKVAVVIPGPLQAAGKCQNLGLAGGRSGNGRWQTVTRQAPYKSTPAVSSTAVPGHNNPPQRVQLASKMGAISC